MTDREEDLNSDDERFLEYIRRYKRLTGEDDDDDDDDFEGSDSDEELKLIKQPRKKARPARIKIEPKPRDKPYFMCDSDELSVIKNTKLIKSIRAASSLRTDGFYQPFIDSLRNYFTKRKRFDLHANVVLLDPPPADTIMYDIGRYQKSKFFGLTYKQLLEHVKKQAKELNKKKERFIVDPPSIAAFISLIPKYINETLDPEYDYGRPFRPHRNIRFLSWGDSEPNLAKRPSADYLHNYYFGLSDYTFLSIVTFYSRPITHWRGVYKLHESYCSWGIFFNNRTRIAYIVDSDNLFSDVENTDLRRELYNKLRNESVTAFLMNIANKGKKKWEALRDYLFDLFDVTDTNPFVEPIPLYELQASTLDPNQAKLFDVLKPMLDKYEIRTQNLHYSENLHYRHYHLSTIFENDASGYFTMHFALWTALKINFLTTEEIDNHLYEDLLPPDFPNHALFHFAILALNSIVYGFLLFDNDYRQYLIDDFIRKRKD